MRKKLIVIRNLMLVAYFLLVIFEPNTAFAATGFGGGKRLIILLQKGSFWLGMAVSLWGIVEAQLDYPGWRGRILKGVLGYIGCLLIPLVFLELQSSLQADVWNQIDAGGGLDKAPTNPELERAVKEYLETQKGGR
jgi:hypothetical protein